MEMVTTALVTLTGVVIGGVLACVPGLHVYTVLAAALATLEGWLACSSWLPPEALASLAIAMVVGWSFLSALPAVLLATPDESAFFTVLPGQKFLRRGRGLEAVQLTAAGALAGLACVLLVFGILAHRLLPLVQAVLQPHYHWILWSVILFMVMAEWPRDVGPGLGCLARFLEVWRSLGMGLLTFLLSGVVGFVLFHRSLFGPRAGFQALMPAFVGLFTAPWLLMNIISRARVPIQCLSKPPLLSASVLLRGTVAGCLGGGFAALVPAVTGGVGGYLAGHATAIRDDRVFLVAQGASRLVYHVGALLLLFVPGLHLARGGAAWIVKSVWVPHGESAWFVALASAALAGAVAYYFVEPLGLILAKLIYYGGLRRLSVIAMLIVFAVVFLLTGFPGLLVAAVATAIGLLPVLYGTRRLNCLGVILLPVACN
ncbi:MAG: tripartite tricarboxylate transporter permease, partial [Kiritimatiellae bacterium]|nr:tripartite tricarboxylate transporter permease [Kiritimatiellia bacterium]